MSRHLLDLPDDCLLLILKKLDLESHELCRIMKVCKRFYDLSFYPELWRIADFFFSRYLYSKKGPIPKDRRKRVMPEMQRRKLFASLLVGRKAILSHLGIKCDICEEEDALRPLIDTCCSRELKYFEIKWTSALMGKTAQAKVHLLREILQKLSVQCPMLFFVQSQLDESCATAEIFATMTNIQHLNLTFPFLQEKDDTNSLEIILSHLKKLKKLEVTVGQHEEPNVEFSGCKLVSNSLRYFDCSESVGFIVQDIDLPRLHTFLAFHILPYRQGITDSPCLFELIEEGCPDLRKLNCRKSIISGLENFPLSEEDKRDMLICGCNEHNPWS